MAAFLMLVWTEISRRTQGFRELSAGEAIALMNDSDTLIVDVSPAADFSNGHIVGARNVALSRLANPDPEMRKWQGRSVLVVCKNGQTARQAAAALVKLGAASVAILKGGMTQWKADHYPVTRN